MLQEITTQGTTLKAVLFTQANTILAQGAALANMAKGDRFEDGDVTTLINPGDRVTVKPPEGIVVME